MKTPLAFPVSSLTPEDSLTSCLEISLSVLRFGSVRTA